MTLRKLWNSIRGKSTTPAHAAAPEPATDVASTPKTPKPTTSDVTPRNASRIAVSRDDKKLCRRIESLSVGSILDVSIGDGSRSLGLLQSLTRSSNAAPLHYVAIDEFEMGGNPLTLREFHQRLREHSVKAQLVPMPIDAGLDRVVRTFGQVDLIIWGSPQPPTPVQHARLQRLSKPGTILFSLDDGRWSETHAGVSPRENGRQAA